MSFALTNENQSLTSESLSNVYFRIYIKGSMTHLQALHISLKFLLQVASEIRRILWKFRTQNLSV